MCYSLCRNSFEGGVELMKQQTSIYINSKGGSIVCYQGNKGRIFRSCVFNSCVYSRDLHLAKLNLDKLEANHITIGK